MPEQNRFQAIGLRMSERLSAMGERADKDEKTAVPFGFEKVQPSTARRRIMRMKPTEMKAYRESLVTPQDPYGVQGVLKVLRGE